MKTSIKDIKGKEKLISDSQVQTKKSTTNPRKDNKDLIKNQNKQKQDKTKIKVFTIKKKEEKTLIKRTYMVDRSITFPLSVKGSQGHKQLWVPKSA